MIETDAQRYRAYAHFLLRGQLRLAGLIPLDPRVPLCRRVTTPRGEPSLRQSCVRPEGHLDRTEAGEAWLALNASGADCWHLGYCAPENCVPPPGQVQDRLAWGWRW